MINTFELDVEDARRYRDEYENKLGIPVALPIEEGVDRILPAIESLKN